MCYVHLSLLGIGLRSLAERINKDVDLKDYVRSYGGRVGRVHGGEIPYKEYNMVRI